MSRRNKANRAAQPKPGDSKQVTDKEAMDAIFKMRSFYANNVYMTTSVRDKSTTIRITFVERDESTGKDYACNSVTMTVEDLQGFYNTMTQVLQNLRTMGRIA